MDIAPFVESLRRDLNAAAAPGGPDVARAAELLSGSIDAAARLALLDALGQAADEVTTKLTSASVELRLRGREPELVVTEHLPQPPEPPAPPTPPGSAATSSDAAGDVTRITLRLPEGLKDAVERSAAGEGISVNAWLVRAIGSAVAGAAAAPPQGTPPGGWPAPPGRGRRHISGYGRA